MTSELVERLGGWANMMFARYGHPVYLVGSTVAGKQNPTDVDLCIEMPDDEFEGRFGDWNTLRSTDASAWSDKNLIWAATIAKESRWLAARTGINADFKIRSLSWIGARHVGKPKVRLDRDAVVNLAEALHRQLAQARAELAALNPRETLEQVAEKEAEARESIIGQPSFIRGFLRCHQMQKEGVLPDE